MSYITNSTTSTPVELTFRDWLERVVTIFSLILISLILLVLDTTTTTTTYWNPFSSSSSSAISTASISSSPNSSRNRIQENDDDSRDNKTVSFATGTKFFRLPKPRSKRHLDSVLPKPSLFKTTTNSNTSASTIPSAATTAATGEFSCITLPTTPTRERLLNYTSQKKQQDSTVSSLLSQDVDWKRAHKLLQAAVQEYPSLQEQQQQPHQQDEEEDKDNEEREERQEVASPSCTNDSTNVLSEERNDIDGDRVTEGRRTSPMSSLFKSMSASSSASTSSASSTTSSSSSSSSTPFDEYDGDDDDESILMIFEDPSSEDFNSGGACTPPIQATPPSHRTNEGYLKNDDNDCEILWETTESESACPPPRSRVRLCFENDPEEDDSCHHDVTTQSPSLLQM
eukprot:scaffold2647_cov75-Cylindrotheca_fusiformis.AAC.1